MPAYSGAGTFPYWMSFTSYTSNAVISSEQVPVPAGVAVQFSMVFEMPVTHPQGVTIALKYFTAGNALINTQTVAFSPVTGGTVYTLQTTLDAEANQSYVVATIEINQGFVAANPMNIYRAEVSDASGNSYNLNYAFSYTTYPWTAGGSSLISLNWNYNPDLVGAYDSLVLNDSIELMGGPQGVPCQVPSLLDSNGVGPAFRLVAPPSMNSAAFGYQESFDLNAPQPTQDVVASMLLDGERPFGTRASNRTIGLPVLIVGTAAGGMQQVLAAQEYLMALIDAQTWTIRWTPADTGLPMLFDCFRALPSIPTWGFNYSAGNQATGSATGKGNFPMMTINLEIQALPYGRSDVDGRQVLQFNNPLVGAVTANSVGTAIDNFTALSNGPVIVASAYNSTAFPQTLSLTSSVPAGSALVVSFVTNNATAQTVSVTDTQGNTYSVQQNPTATGTQQVVLTSVITKALNVINDTLTITSTLTSGVKSVTVYLVPTVSSIVSSSATGTSAAPAVTTTATGNGSNTGLVIYANASNDQTTASPAGWTPFIFTDVSNVTANAYWEVLNNPNAVTATAAYVGSIPWTAVSISFNDPPGSTWNLDTTHPVPAQVGNSVHYQAPRPMKMPWPPAVYSSYFPAAPVSIVGQSALSVWFGQAYDTQWPTQPKFVSNVTLRWTLYDDRGYTLQFLTTKVRCPWGENPSQPKWTRITASIPQNSNTFDYSNVVGYSVDIRNWSGSGASGYVRMHAWLSNITANPQSISNPSSPRGYVYNVFGLPGAARSPVSVQCQLPQSQPQVQEFANASGIWTVPAGVYSVMAECFGGGGAGSSLNAARAIGGGGGGGGEYAQEPALAVVPGQKIPYVAGAGGTAAQLSNTVIQFNTPGLSHWTCPAGVTSVVVECWGAGGAGAAGGGGGGGGAYSSKTQTVVPGTTYYLWCAGGGTPDTGTSSAQNAMRDGQSSWFGPNGNKVGSTAFVYALGGSTCTTGGTNAGSGGKTASGIGTVKFPGGYGGESPGAAGGGGGGAAGATGRGGFGLASPPAGAGGRYTTGGTAGAGTGQGGSGGAGANAPGTPVPGTAPGGGGGGGYTGTQIVTKGGKTTTTYVNYLGANGGNGLVQLTYAIGGGAPVQGAASTFGSAGTTGTVVTAHGGGSVNGNISTGGTGGTGSSNTLHFNGGNGSLFVTGAQGAYVNGVTEPASIPTLSTLSTFTYNSTTHTSGNSSASVSQGVAIALVESTAVVSDLTVVDSVGNNYLQISTQQAGAGANGVTLYAFIANIVTPITTSTTLTVTSATSQQYGVIWYGSPFLLSGISPQNAAGNSGTSTSGTVQFGIADSTSNQFELVVMLNDGTEAWNSPTGLGTAWFAAAATNTLAAGAMTMTAWMGLNQGGGTGAANTGDVLTAGLAGSANWASLAIPLVSANQDIAPVRLTAVANTNPGASTNWTNAKNISPNGMILVVGISGTGVTSAPSSVSDGGGNVYTQRKVQSIAGNGNGAMWMFTAPVTAGMASGAAGTVHWGSASAVPSYTYGIYWLPEATGFEAVSGVSGSSTSISGSYTPLNTNSTVFSLAGSLGGALSAVSVTGGNVLDLFAFNSLNADFTGQQAVDKASVSVTATVTPTDPWGVIQLGMTSTVQGGGGGAGAGPGGPGYNAVNYFGAPGYSGGGKGGNGAFSVNTAGQGAAYPGGGGGGAASNNSSPDSGGNGANGMVRLTWQPQLQPFNTLLVHRPGDNAPQTLSPLVPIPLNDVPNNIEYTVPSLVPGLNADFDGTYTVMLCNYSWNPSTAGSPRSISVTIRQYEYQGGPSYSVQVTRAITPATDIVNGMVSMGEVTLPIKQYAAHNDLSYFTVSLNDTDTLDRFQDVLFLDTTGQTAIININPGAPGAGTYVNYYIDEASPDRDLGFVGGTVLHREYQVSVLEYTQITGGPLYILPGDNTILTYSPNGAPNLGVTYDPRWYTSRTV